MTTVSLIVIVQAVAFQPAKLSLLGEEAWMYWKQRESTWARSTGFYNHICYVDFLFV